MHFRASSPNTRKSVQSTSHQNYKFPVISVCICTVCGLCSLITQFCHSSCTGSLKRSKACQLNSQTTVRLKLTSIVSDSASWTHKYCRPVEAARWLHAKVRLLIIGLVCQKKSYRTYASLNSNHKIHSINTRLLPAWFHKLNHAQPTPHVPPREKEIMRRTEKERQREETGGVLQSDWPSLVSLQAAWCTPSHSPWLFLPKCCFDQDNITGMEMGMQTRRGGLILEHNWRVVTF